jgi:hypothetical protein
MRYSTTYEIVSNADTSILLKNPCTAFAEWVEPVPPSVFEITEAATGLSVSKPLSKKDKKKSKKGKSVRSSGGISQAPVVDKGDPTPAVVLPADDGVSSSAAILPIESSKGLEQDLPGVGSSETKQAVATLEMGEPGEAKDDDDSSSAVIDDACGTGAVPQPVFEPEEEERVRFQVCTGNLMSGSPWFNRALGKNGWMESGLDPEHGKRHISAEDWDEEAFLILMNIIHLRNHEVPRTITLEMLAKFAVIADYYECGESVDLFIDMWVADLSVKTPIPTTYCRNLILWMWITWAFELSEIFNQVTAVAIGQSDQPVRNLGLPIPAWVVGMYYVNSRS